MMSNRTALNTGTAVSAMALGVAGLVGLGACHVGEETTDQLVLDHADGDGLAAHIHIDGRYVATRVDEIGDGEGYHVAVEAAGRPLADLSAIPVETDEGSGLAYRGEIGDTEGEGSSTPSAIDPEVVDTILRTLSGEAESMLVEDPEAACAPELEALAGLASVIPHESDVTNSAFDKGERAIGPWAWHRCRRAGWKKCCYWVTYSSGAQQLRCCRFAYCWGTNRWR